MLSLTACVWTGMVMMRMLSSTRITSMRRVALMSTMTSGSCPPPAPSFIAMIRLPLAPRFSRRRFRDEADLQNAGALARIHDPADELVAPILVATDVDLRLGNLHCDFLQPVEQPALIHRLLVRDHVPILAAR